MKIKASCIFAVFCVLTFCFSPAVAQTSSSDSQGSASWSFGVIADTQWTTSDDGYNPNSVAANIISQVNQEFIHAGVSLVIAVGDTVNTASKVSIDTRALYAQDLYNAGIGFYPLRGNHEATGSYLDSGLEFRYAFPQIGTGLNNNTPADITVALLPPADREKNRPADRTGQPFTVGSTFSEPVRVNTGNRSLSYSFRFKNATFMLLDQFDGAGSYTNSTIPQQMGWINNTLQARPANTHAFVFSHKNILGEAAKDNLFGAPLVPADPAAGKDPGDGSGMDTSLLTVEERSVLASRQAAEDNFLASMQSNGVYFVISGHDHHHSASWITSPDANSHVHQITGQSASSKFLFPHPPFSGNQAPIQEDLDRIGYYLVTVNGQHATLDYYADTTGAGYYGPDGGDFHFVKRSSMSYSLNGKDWLVPQGASYSMTDDTTAAARREPGFLGTSMSILAGVNDSHATTSYGKPVVADVSTGWSAWRAGLASDILRLRGIGKTPGGDRTDIYVLSMSYLPGLVSDELFVSGSFGLLTRNTQGEWVNAGAQVSDSSGIFVLGSWHSGDPPGTYGVDPITHNAWAVLDYEGDFCVGGRIRFYIPAIVH